MVNAISTPSVETNGTIAYTPATTSNSSASIFTPSSSSSSGSTICVA